MAMDNDIEGYLDAHHLNPVAYALCNAQRRVLHCSETLPHFVTAAEGLPLLGQPLEQLFDEFVGLEEDLQLICLGQLPGLQIEMTARLRAWLVANTVNTAVEYITLHITAWHNQTLLLTLFDVTPQAILLQKEMQQRNELALQLAQSDPL